MEEPIQKEVPKRSQQTEEAIPSKGTSYLMDEYQERYIRRSETLLVLEDDIHPKGVSSNYHAALCLLLTVRTCPCWLYRPCADRSIF